MSKINLDDVKRMMRLTNTETMEEFKSKLISLEKNTLPVGTERTFMQKARWNGVCWEFIGRGWFSEPKGSKVGASYGQRKTLQEKKDLKANKELLDSITTTEFEEEII